MRLLSDVDQTWNLDSATEGIEANSIAVMPFLNMSDDPENKYFSDGISEELLHLLAGISGLRVISRSSSFAIADLDLSIPEIGRRLGVANVLEGSVRKSGDQVRITAQLIAAQDDAHLWSATYDRVLDDVFAVQDEIAQSVVTQLEPHLLNDLTKSKRVNVEAFNKVLQARYFWNRRSMGDEEKALALYREAVDIDSGYADAWTGLSVALAVEAMAGRIDYQTGVAQAEQAAEMAIQLDPQSSDAHVRLGQARERARNYTEARALYEAAVELNPSSPLAIAQLGEFLKFSGILEESIRLYRLAETLDPATAIWPANLSEAYLRAGRKDEAEAALQRAFSISPGLENSPAVVAEMLVFLRQPQELLGVIEDLQRVANAATHDGLQCERPVAGTVTRNRNIDGIKTEPVQIATVNHDIDAARDEGDGRSDVAHRFQWFQIMDGDAGEA